MIKIENVEVFGWRAAIRGMRNPMNSWDKSDSEINEYGEGEIGQNDLNLMQRLVKSGPDHRKFMRMLTVICDITAPLYWWKEFDTYKVGTVTNSTSTMHKITAKEFTIDDFSVEYLKELAESDREQNLWYVSFGETIKNLNVARRMYLDECKMSDDSKINYARLYWHQIIQSLPSSYNQKRTVQMNYEVLANIYKSRKNHKLDEWRIVFCDWICTLPYSELIKGDD